MLTKDTPHAAVLAIVVDLTLWQRVRLLVGTRFAVKLGIETSKYPGRMKMGAKALLGRDARQAVQQAQQNAKDAAA